MEQDKQPKPAPIVNLELIAAITLGVLAVSCFLIQALTTSSSTTRKETALFSCLEFLLTVGFSWFSTRAISRREFEQNLKRFAISAYRRIADIERVVARLQSQVRSMITEDAEDNSKFFVVDAIVADTAQIVRSSIADWADVIGDELLAVEKIKRLEQEKAELNTVSSPVGSVVTENELRKINNEIGKLRASLPALMQFPGGSDLETLQEMERKARWMAATHKRRGGLELDVKTGSEYPHERSLSTLVPREVLHSLKDERGALDVADASGATIGRLTNPTPLPYDDFVTAFEMCYGSAFVSLEFLRIHSDYKSTEGEIGNDSEWEAWCEVRVLQQPIL